MWATLFLASGCALLHLQHIVGPELDGLDDRVAVRGSQQQRAQDQQIERALQQLDTGAVASNPTRRSRRRS